MRYDFTGGYPTSDYPINDPDESASSAPPGPAAGHYYSFGNNDQGSIFTVGSTTALFDDGSDGDATTDVRSTAFNATFGIYWGGSSVNIDRLKVVAGVQGSSGGLLNCYYLDGPSGTGSWQVFNALIPGYTPSAASYAAMPQAIVSGPGVIAVYGIRVGLNASGGTPSTNIGCFDLRAFEGTTERPA